MASRRSSSRRSRKRSRALRSTLPVVAAALGVGAAAVGAYALLAKRRSRNQFANGATDPVTAAAALPVHDDGCVCDVCYH